MLTWLGNKLSRLLGALKASAPANALPGQHRAPRQHPAASPRPRLSTHRSSCCTGGAARGGSCVPPQSPVPLLTAVRLLSLRRRKGRAPTGQEHAVLLGAAGLGTSQPARE